ncbi:hypothetical protein EII29_02455 [Leptotrichia sp. OH3620_COT-345]|uniref:hypothetical protein n=1 Tax=Leptotrichia sp. OH3620_COT-345 TaxID=2491048 RepID=UPI000F64A12F|nr:hypothetical protein [Leptotrichia sp. OH3620_COT-345]RRD40360.1 hypothetical protein EII29_02455 [Leptotrichia sp. OH3620_COT-345]
MKKKIILLVCLGILSTIGFANPTSKVTIGTFNPRLELINRATEGTTEINDKNFDFTEKEKTEPSSNYVRGGGGIRSISGSVNLDSLFNTLDNYYEIANKATELSFNAVSRSADSATVAASLAGSTRFMGGVATMGSNIQLILQKLLAMRKRVDDLKQYKRFLDSVRTFNKNDLKTLAEISTTLDRLDGIVSEGFDLKEKTVAYGDLVRNSDLSTFEGWENLMMGDINLKNVNDEALDRLSGNEAGKVLKALNEAKARIRNMNPQNATQEMTKLNAQINLLISMFEKYMSDSAAVATKEILADNKKVEEEIASKQERQESITKLNNYQEKLKKEVREAKKRNRFAGDLGR